MDSSAAREVEPTAVCDPAPIHPLEDRAEYQKQPGRGEDRPSRELHAIGHRAGDQGRRDHGEHAQKGHYQQSRAAVFARYAQAREEGQVEVPQESSVTRLCQRVTDDHPGDGDDEQTPEVHHQHVQDVSRPVHASVEQRQTRCHEQHQGRGRQHPRRITSIHQHSSQPGWFVAGASFRGSVSAVFLLVEQVVNTTAPVDFDTVSSRWRNR